MAATETPSRVDTSVVLERIGAQVVDVFTMIILYLGLSFMIGLVFGFLFPNSVSTVGEEVFTIISVFSAISIFLGYNIILETAWNGQTLGKRLFGIRVVKENGDPVTGAEVVIRNIPAILTLGWFAYLVAFLSMAISDKRQRLFDRLAGTIVVKE